MPSLGSGASLAVGVSQQQAAAEAERQRVLRAAKTGSLRFQAAERARANGDIRLAAMLYLRNAKQRPANAHTEPSKQALKDLAAKGQPRLDSASRALENGDINGAYLQFTTLADQYEGVPGIGAKAKAEAERMHEVHQYAAALNECKAAQLWEAARELEARDQLCCAYLTYERAATLSPAVSARRADERLKLLAKSPDVLKAAESCRTVRECHKLYETADRLIKTTPEQARAIFRQIVKRAPPESEVHVAAREQLARGK